MVAQTQAIPQVVRRHLDGRLADRVGDLGHRVGVRLDDQNPRGWTRSANLQRQRESRHASSDDAHVVIRCWVIGVREARSDALRESLSCLLTHLRHLRSHVHALPFPRVVPTYPDRSTAKQAPPAATEIGTRSAFDARAMQHRVRRRANHTRGTRRRGCGAPALTDRIRGGIPVTRSTATDSASRAIEAHPRVSGCRRAVDR